MERKSPTSEELLKNMYNNRGKYFDPVQFNKAFDVYIEEQTKDRLLNQKVKLDDLNRIENINIPPTQLPLKNLFINIKNSWTNLINNLINGKKLFSNTDDSFYFGLTFIIIALIYLVREAYVRIHMHIINYMCKYVY
jgi:hypothetical protein